MNFTGKKYTCPSLPATDRIFYVISLDKYDNGKWMYKIEIREFNVMTYYIYKENLEYNFRTKYFVEVK